MQKGQTIKHLPEELIAEILLSLRVKSLLRFKSVSKPWRSLISSATFVQDHLNRSISDPELTHHNLLGNLDNLQIFNCLGSRSLKSLLDEPNHDHNISVWDRHYPIGNNTAPSSITILGSCNGLILISLFERRVFFLWNPSTRKSLKTIPPPPPCPQRRCGSFVYGFGYDDSNNDYRVVRITSHFTPNHTDEIYSVRTNSWKKIDGFRGMIVSDDHPGKFVNGKLHWVGVRWRPGDMNIVIVSLGLVEGEEKYRVVASPSHFSKYASGETRLEVLGGYLSVIGSFRGGNEMRDVHIWVMIKYGEVESWTKTWTLSDFDGRYTMRRVFRFWGPFWVTKNGDMFVLFSKRETKNGDGSGEVVVVCNGENKLREYPTGRDELQESYYIRLDGKISEYELIVYVESLVSP